MSYETDNENRGELPPSPVGQNEKASGRVVNEDFIPSGVTLFGRERIAIPRLKSYNSKYIGVAIEPLKSIDCSLGVTLLGLLVLFLSSAQ